MVKETKFYDLLGVSPTASETELKKAYRKKALALHPDKGGDPEQFKAVTSAYEVLSDSQKRDMYDRFGEQGLNEGAGGMGGMDPQDLFSQLFGGAGGGFFGGGGSGRSRGPRKGKDLVHRVKVSLEELFAGKTTKLALQKHVICSGCDGKGGKEGAVKTCHSCNGQGIKIVLRQLGPMVQQMQAPCNECSGTGEIIDPKHRCKQCLGKKVVQTRVVLEANISRGMEDGQSITFKEEADQAPGTIPGDVVIVVEEKPHPRFKRRKNDLFTTVDVDLLSALAGGKFPIEHLAEDHVLSVEIPPGEVVKPGAMKVLRGQGMPSYRHHEMGDLYVSINIVFPDSMPLESIPLLEKALPARKPMPKLKNSADIEDVLLEDMDEGERQKAANGGSVDEDGDEEMGGPGVQCASQ